jgi:Zn finger protein HypA/HybF involved in hydrogenase expression
MLELTNAKIEEEFEKLALEIASLEHSIDQDSRRIVQAQKELWQICEDTWGHEYEADDGYLQCTNCGAWNTEIDDDPEADNEG